MRKLTDLFRQESSGRDMIILSAIFFIAALAVRFWILLQGSIISNDALYYVLLAKSIGSGTFEQLSGFSFFSIHPFFVFLAHKIIPDWELAGKVVSLLCGSLAVVPLLILFSKLAGKRIAMVAALLYVLGPRFVEYSTDILRESTFWLFSLTALCFVWKAIDRKRIIYIVLAAIFVGLSCATKIEGLALFPIIVLWVCCALLTKTISARTAFGHLIVFILIIPLFGVLALLMTDSGSWSWAVSRFVQKVAFLLEGNGAAPSSTMDSGVLMNMPSGSVLLFELAQKYKYLLFCVEIIFKSLKSLTLIPVFLVLAGLFFRKNVRLFEKEVYVIIWLGVFFVVSLYYMRGTSYFGTRHGLLLGIPALIWAGTGFLEVKDRVVGFMERLVGSRRAAMTTSVVVFCLVFVILFAQTIMTAGKEDKMALKITGIELKRKGYADSIMLVQSNLHRLAFYADSQFVMMPDRMSSDSVIETMRANNASILVVDLTSIDSAVTDFRVLAESKYFERITLEDRPKEKGYALAAYKLKDLR